MPDPVKLTTPNMNPANPANPSADGNRILTELNELKETLAQQQALINKQQTMLLDQSSKPATPEAAKSTEDVQFNNAQEFIQYVVQQVTDASTTAVDTRMDGYLREFTPLLKEATKESPVWQKQKEVEQIVADNPGLSYELASELAETRMAKQEANQKELASSAEDAARQLAASQASVGQPGTATGNMPAGVPNAQKNLSSIMENKWESLDLNTKLTDFNNQQDVWGAPAVPGVVTTANEPAS